MEGTVRRPLLPRGDDRLSGRRFRARVGRAFLSAGSVQSRDSNSSAARSPPLPSDCDCHRLQIATAIALTMNNFPQEDKHDKNGLHGCMAAAPPHIHSVLQCERTMNLGKNYECCGPFHVS